MGKQTKRFDDGATLVEFALLLPVLVMLLFGLVEFGVAYDHQQALTGGAREGARAASIGKTDTEIRDRVTAALGGSNYDGPVTVTIAATPAPGLTTLGPCDSTNTGATVNVDVSVGEKVSIPFVTDRTITLKAKGSFLCE